MKLATCILFLSLSNFAGASHKDSVSVSSDATADSIVSYAKQFLGIPYVWAGASPSAGFDCSGFVYYVFIHFGHTIQRSSSGLSNAGKPVSLEEAKKGDLILFRGTNPDDKSVGHVGIVISDKGDSLQFIHASSSQKHFGVVITNYLQSNYPSRYVGVRRILE